MIILDSNKTLNEFIKKEKLEYISLSLELKSFIEQKLESDIAIVDSKFLSDNSVIKKLGSAIGWFSFGETSDLKNKDENYLGHINPEADNSVQMNIIQTLNKSLEQTSDLKNNLVKLNTEMLDVVSGVESELLRIKKLYERSAPKRFDQLKGLTYISKYAAGESSGGEFFDAVKINSKLLVLMSSCDSYLTSSCILNLFAELKNNQDINKDNLRSFVEEVTSEINILSAGGKVELDCNLMICMLDFNSFEVSGHVFGHFDMTSSNENHEFHGNNLEIKKSNLKGSYFEMHLKRKERLLLMSPGFKFNWDLEKRDIIIEDVITDDNIKPNDLLDELFFQMKKDVVSGFLKHDASAIMLEVDQNVMLQI